MSSVDDAFLAAESREPAEKLKLISLIWESIPQSATYRPPDSDLAEIKLRWSEYESGGEEPIPWSDIWEETERELNLRHEG